MFQIDVVVIDRFDGGETKENKRKIGRSANHVAVVALVRCKVDLCKTTIVYPIVVYCCMLAGLYWE